MGWQRPARARCLMTPERQLIQGLILYILSMVSVCSGLMWLSWDLLSCINRSESLSSAKLRANSLQSRRLRVSPTQSIQRFWSRHHDFCPSFNFCPSWSGHFCTSGHVISVPPFCPWSRHFCPSFNFCPADLSTLDQATRSRVAAAIHRPVWPWKARSRRDTTAMDPTRLKLTAAHTAGPEHTRNARPWGPANLSRSESCHGHPGHWHHDRRPNLDPALVRRLRPREQHRTARRLEGRTHDDLERRLKASPVAVWPAPQGAQGQAAPPAAALSLAAQAATGGSVGSASRAPQVA
jgi:hypothetical protein